MKAKADRILTFENPGGAFYLMLDISNIIGLKHKSGEIVSSDASFSEMLLRYKGVAVVPGGAFGLVNSVRISFATDDENIINACERINSFVSALK